MYIGTEGELKNPVKMDAGCIGCMEMWNAGYNLNF